MKKSGGFVTLCLVFCCIFAFGTDPRSEGSSVGPTNQDWEWNQDFDGSRGTSIGDCLAAGQSMLVDQQLESANGKYLAVLQGDGNFVIYRTNPWEALWAKAGTWNKPIKRLTLFTNGDLRILGTKRVLSHYISEGQMVRNYSSTTSIVTVWYNIYFDNGTGRLLLLGRSTTTVFIPPGQSRWILLQCPVYVDIDTYVYWHTNTSTPQNNCILVMQNDGNLVLYDTSSAWRAVWASNTAEPSVLPLSVHISGPTKGNNSGTYTWNAQVSGGTPPYSYLWKYGYNGNDYIYEFGTTQSVTAQLPLDRDLYLKVVVTDSEQQELSDTFVTINLGDSGTHPERLQSE